MHEYDLIAVLDGLHTIAPVEGLELVPAAGMTAVLRPAPRPLLRLPQSRATQLTAAALRLQLQEACMPLATLLPVRQAGCITVFGAGAFLCANQPFLHDVLARFAGMVQLQVTVAWDTTAVLHRFSHEPELAAIFARGRVAEAELIAAVAHLAARLGGVMWGLLAKATVAQTPLPMTADLLWNGALLLHQSQLPALDHAVEAIDAIWPEGLRIRQIGPAPVASFALLELEPVTPAQITAALGLLGLRSLADLGDLGAARRRLLMEDTAATAERREAIRTAARIIEAAARVPNPRAEFALCRTWAEGQATPDASTIREVA